VADGRSRVTVVGDRRRVDVALPSAAPIGEYSAGLATLCGHTRGGGMPAAWSLAVAGAAPLAPTESLAESGVVDGQVLYLRDAARDAQADPIVADLDELLAGEAAQQRAADWPRPVVVIAFGLAWLAAAAVMALVWAPSPALATALTLIAVGLLLVGGGWALAQRRTVVPAALCVVMALSSVPCLAVAGALLAGLLAGGEFRWTGALAGAAAAVLMTLAATPEAVVALIGIQLCAALLLAPVLLVAHATGAQGAAAAVVLMLCLIGLAKRGAAVVAVWAGQRPVNGAAAEHAATAVLVRTRLLMTALVAGPCLSLVLALPVLARSGDGYAFALTATAATGLLIRARQSGFSNEWVPLGGAGLVGAFAVLAALVGTLGQHRIAVLAALIVAGLLLVAGGVIAAVIRSGADPVADLPPGFPASAGPSRWRRTLALVGLLCVLASAVLALGEFGVFHDLAGMGRSMIGN
jgi:hypothetical protein